MKRKIVTVLIILIVLGCSYYGLKYLLHLKNAATNDYLNSAALGYIDTIEKEIAIGYLNDITYPVGKIDILTSEHYKDIKYNRANITKGTLYINNQYRITSASLCIDNYKVDLLGYNVHQISKNKCDEIK